MTGQQPDSLPQRTPGATFNADKPPATTQPPATPTGWSDPWTRPAAWTAFGASKGQK